MCVYVCEKKRALEREKERERERERKRDRDTLMNNTRWGMSNYIRLASTSSSNTKIPTMRYI